MSVDAPKVGRLAPRMRVEVEVETIAPPEPFEVGSWVRVTGLHGFFRVLGGSRDGGLSVYGGASGRFSTRTFLPDRCRLATKKELREAGLS